MANFYVSDFEELGGVKAEQDRVVETKVVSAPVEVQVAPTTEAEVK